MKKNCFGFALFLAAVFLALCGCTNAGAKPEEKAREAGYLTLMTWNVHNLFDGKDNGFEYDEFLEASGWSQEKFKGRVNTISDAIGKIRPAPDIICFQEIESLLVLEELSAALNDGYKWSHFAANPGAALGVGVLSRYPLSDAKSHSVTVDNDTTPRPVLETRVAAENEEFVLFVCHWKSKLGGDDITENVRRASARVILRRIRELREKEPGVGIVVAGDLNENHDEFFRRNSAVICALLPDDPYCALLTGCIEDIGRQRDFIVLAKSRPPEPVHFPQGAVVLFSPWVRDLESGSYYYKHNWETIDHFLISQQFFNNSGWEYVKAQTANYPPFVNSGGQPVSYNARTGSGLSDHLPLLLSLKKVSGE
jgi:endonuclease/exonuclease/phosphatase family metal-dependent hydrolase